ncbi:uncharacterized protein LOC111621802 [Centruroides sculpturatus]|uniref:uncharacterized protein LOC111621802 n=1 Tax=Centruroides sculpturatus TaxID=218467 RepID=UPI000C6ED6E7|nr:uncharacterized protein LOC111621802 [Centruroides sculpturatus]
MTKLKALKLHQTKAKSCKASIESFSPAPIPENRRIRRFTTRPRHRQVRRATIATAMDTTTSPCSDTSASPPQNNTSPTTSSHNNRRRSGRTQMRRTTNPAPISPEDNAPATVDSRHTASSTPPATPRHHTAQPVVIISPLPNSNWTRSEPFLSRPPSPPTDQPHVPVPEAQPNPGCPPPACAPVELQPPTDQQSTDVPSWALAWRDRFNIALDPDMLEVMTNDLVTMTQEMCAIRVHEPTTNRHQQPITACDASKIQKLYRINRKRAMTIITEGQPTYCEIDKDCLYEHFRSVHSSPTDSQGPCPTLFPQTLQHDNNDPLTTPFTPEEVKARFRRCHNTASGPDGLRYQHWNRLDPHGVILSSVFNAVLRTSHIPQGWQKSNTILIYKGGDKQDVTNWRPIALSCTLGKLYTACLANRLLTWCLDNNIFSHSQKGFLPYEGCLEHNFLLQASIKDARRQRKDCHVAWLDIANAFGSVPHRTNAQCLQWSGLHEKSIEIIMNLLANNSTRIRAQDGYTDDIPILSGVRQGCPLSPLIFNIVVETAIKCVKSLNNGYNLMGEEVSIIAYADDLALISATREGLQQQLDAITEWADWAGLHFKPRKCATLSVIGPRHTTENITFSIQGSTLPSLSPDDTYKHLGVPTGFSTHPTDPDIFNKISEDIPRLDRAKLAPWQKIDALNTILLPRLSFHLLAGSNPKKPLHKLDRHIVKHTKKWMNLPQRASSEIINIPNDFGGANIPSCYTLAAISQVTQAMHLLTSKDPTICLLATSFLKDVVRKRIYRDPSLEDICTYLNGSMNDEFGAKSYDISSIWTRLRIATRRLRKTIDCGWTPVGNTIAMACENNLTNRANCTNVLSTKYKLAQLNCLLRKPDQGKSFKIISGHPASSHFLKSGNYTTFADWRFVHRARLSIVPLHGHRRFGNTSKKCRQCNYPRETLAHMLNHCTRNLHMATKRHDAVLNRLHHAIRPGNFEILTNQQVPGYNDRCRPDLVVISDTAKTATIVDVCIPFENGQDAFDIARRAKEEKYRNVKEYFRRQSYNTTCDAFILGSLGGYDHQNTSVLQRLGISRNYSRTMIKLMVSDTIRWSREIYHHHLQRPN